MELLCTIRFVFIYIDKYIYKYTRPILSPYKHFKAQYIYFASICNHLIFHFCRGFESVHYFLLCEYDILKFASDIFSPSVIGTV